MKLEKLVFDSEACVILFERSQRKCYTHSYKMKDRHEKIPNYSK